ncbi:MAG: transporter substrate-binding domain-containing protein, partial [Prevotellaceae bacterium]|nr:transporter substrate-binding domain-containing protein [Prevotellaceae bacterium]
MKAKHYIFIAVALVLVVILVLFLLGNNKQETLRDYAGIKQEGVLRVVTEYGELGYMPDIENDTVRGFQYDLLRMLADSLHLEVKIFAENSVETSLKGLREGKFDLIARNIPITTELRKKVAFTDPILKNRQVLVQRTQRANDRQQPIRNQLDLGGKTLYVPENSPFLLRLRN